MATTELELQEITALPKKVSSQITATDYLMGIDSAEGYQMLIQDIGDYIIQKVASSINGQDQTLVQALSALDSKLLVQTGGNITADNVNNLKEPAIYSRYIEAVAITGDSSMGNHFGLFIVTNSPNVERVGQYILMPNSGRVAMRYDNSGTWTAWQILATKAEVDALNSKPSVNLIYLNKSDDDLDNMFNTADTGFYITGANTLNSPNPYCATIVIARNGTCSQVQFGASKIYARKRTGSPLEWIPWKSVDISQ